MQSGKALAFEGIGKEFDRAQAESLVQRMCTNCDFRKDGCDFMMDRQAPPCGGFVLLAQLIEAGIVTIDDL